VPCSRWDVVVNLAVTSQRMEEKIASLHQVIADMRAQNQRLTQALADTQAELVCGQLRQSFYVLRVLSCGSLPQLERTAGAADAATTVTASATGTTAGPSSDLKTPTQENATTLVLAKPLPSVPTSSKVARRILGSRVSRLTAESRYEGAPGSMRSPSVL
jgi:hypothetical protein